MSADHMAEKAHDPYHDIAEWYDLEHDSLTDDVECYTTLMREDAASARRVLEVGAGTGRVCAALALAGYHVTGVEPSAAMRSRAEHRLEALPQRVARRIRMVKGTASEPGLEPDERFDVVLFGLNVFAHLLNAQERHISLLAAARHLVPGGLVIVDLDLAGARRLSEHPGMLWWQGTWPVSGHASHDVEVSHFITAGRGGKPWILEVLHFYDVSAPGGAIYRTTARMPLAVVSYGELAVELVRAGFHVEATYGTHDLAPLDDGAPRAIVVASLLANSDAGKGVMPRSGQIQSGA